MKKDLFIIITLLIDVKVEGKSSELICMMFKLASVLLFISVRQIASTTHTMEAPFL